MRKLWLAWLACLLVVAPLELSAKHIVKHRSARAQGCAVGQTPPSTGCGIGDMSVGGALSSTDAIAICQQAGGCPASASTWQLTKVPLMSSVRGVLSAAAPIVYNASTGQFSCPTCGTGGVTIPTAQLLGGSAGAYTTITLGSNLSFSGPAASPTLNASVTGGGGGTVTQVNLSPGFTTTPGTCNTGSTPQAITTSGTISGQTCVVPKTSSYPLAGSDTGNLLVANGAGITFTAPAPTAGAQGVSYQFGGNGINAYSITAGGTAQFYGCASASTGPSTNGVTTLTVPGSYDVVITNDNGGGPGGPTTPGYKCTQMGAPTDSWQFVWGPGQNLTSVPAFPLHTNNGARTRTLIGINCRVEKAVGSGTATLAVRWAADGTALASGTDPTSNLTCNADGTLYTQQSLTVNAANAVVPSPNGAVGVIAAGGDWATSVGAGVLEIVYRGD